MSACKGRKRSFGTTYRIPAPIREAKPVIINLDDEAYKEDMRVFLDIEVKPSMANRQKKPPATCNVLLREFENV